MKQWTVTYRDKNGSKASVVIEAEDRAGVFAELKKRGISAISVEEGASNKKPRKAPSSGASSKGRGLIAAAMVVLVAGIVAWWMYNLNEEPRAVSVPEKNKSVTIKEKSPVGAKQIAKKEQKAIVIDPKTQIVAVISCQTNTAQGQICEIYKTADGKTHRNYRPVRPPIFKHVTDRMLATVLVHDPHVPMPPLPMGIGGADLDKRFLESLKDPIVITDEDSEKDVEKKQRVIEVRELVKELIMQGHHFSDILAEHRSLFNENVKIRSEAMRELNKIHAQGDVEGEHKYMTAINAALEQMGIEKLDNPLTPEERRAQREARRIEREQKKENR